MTVGCSAVDVVHGCAGPVCQVGWLADERALPVVTVDLTPYAPLVHAAAFGLAKGLYLGGQSGMGQSQDNPHQVLDDCIKGKAAEMAYAVHAGLDPRMVINDARSKADFRAHGLNVDVKYAKPVGGLLRCTLAKGTWDRIKHDRTYELVAVTVDGWTAQLLGRISTADLARAMSDGLVPCHPPKGRTGGGYWYEVRVGLLKSVS